MGVTVPSDSVRKSVTPGLVILPLEDIDEQLQAVAIWKSSDTLRPKELFVDYLTETG